MKCQPMSTIGTYLVYPMSTSIDSSEKMGFRGLSLSEEYILLNFLAHGNDLIIFYKKS